MTAVMTMAPNVAELTLDTTTVFMAGSIEMGKAEDWQTRLFKMTSDLPVQYLNPRRDEWDSSWEQSVHNEKFVEQVKWELERLKNLKHSGHQVFYFDSNTTSPITLMELEFVAADHNVIAVCCPKGYFRKGNVDIVCRQYGIPVVETLEELAQAIREAILADRVSVDVP